MKFTENIRFFKNINYKNSLVFVLIICGFLSIRIYIFNNYNIGFYQHKDDYSSHSLGHGINIDKWLHSSKRTIGYFQTTHPGIPFQLISGLVYEMTTFKMSGTYLDNAIQTLKNPEKFWKYNQIVSFIFFVISVGILYLYGLKKSLKTSILMIMIYLSYIPVWTYGYDYLGNESFSLILFFCLVFFANKSFSSPEKIINWFVTGLICGVCYLNKLNYITWSVAFVFAGLIFIILQKINFVNILKITLTYGFGFILSIILIGLPLLRPRGLKQMYLTHLAIIFHTGYYGTGSEGVVSIKFLGSSIVSFITDYSFFTILVILVLILSLVVLFRFIKNYKNRSKPISYLIFLVSCFLLSFLSGMKHYRSYYIITSLVTLPFLVFFISDYLPKKNQIVTFFLFLVLVLNNTKNYVETSINDYKEAIKYESELNTVRSLALSDNELRIWQYRIRAPEYLSYFSAETSGVKEVNEKLKLNSLDLGVFDGLPYITLNWKYFVYDKNIAPNFDTLPIEIKKICKVVFDGNYLLVVERLEAN
jgi:hypothetical protein